MGQGRNALVESLSTDGKPFSSGTIADVVFGVTSFLRAEVVSWNSVRQGSSILTQQQDHLGLDTPTQGF